MSPTEPEHADLTSKPPRSTSVRYFEAREVPQPQQAMASQRGASGDGRAVDGPPQQATAGLVLFTRGRGYGNGQSQGEAGAGGCVSFSVWHKNVSCPRNSGQ